MEPQDIGNHELDVDYISQLPYSVVHKIYSLLPSRDVASTSVLSKAWNSYWFAYPYVEFQFAYSNYPKELPLPMALQKKDFLEFIENAVLRRLGSRTVLAGMPTMPGPRASKIYKSTKHIEGSKQRKTDKTGTTLLERELYLQGFKMCIEFYDLYVLAPYLDRWISIAIRKGVPEFALRVETGFGDLRCHYTVPQVVMQADTLKELSLNGCTFGRGLEVRLPHLKKLSLQDCEFVDDLSFHTIMFGCPVIEYLKISDCGWIGKILSLMNLPQLKHFELLRCKDIDYVNIYATNLHTLSFVPALKQLPPSFDLKSCQELRELKINSLKNFLPEHLISQLPALEVLELEDCTCSEVFTISSKMLKRLALRNCHKLNLKKVDTPNLESLEYCHSGWPFSLINPSKTLKLHLINAWVGDAPVLSELQRFLSTSTSDLKLVLYRDPESIIIHEKVNDFSLSSLSNYIYSKFIICISSKSLTDLMDELIPLYPKKVYIVHSHDNTLQVVGRILNLQPKLIGYKVNTDEDGKDLTSVFIEKLSIPPYKNSVLTLNWIEFCFNIKLDAY